tara:strand:- start:3555 stop:3788 length:234 start_codon:yes stop_codon:yes gene_type:complete
MNITIVPIDIDGQTATEGIISVAVSESVAIRIVPIIDGSEYPDYALGLVGADGTPDTVVLLNAVRDAVQCFVSGRGF